MRHGEVIDSLGMFDGNLRIQYLEHVIDKLGEGNADLHQRLIDLYIRILKRTSISSDEPENPEAKLVSFLSDIRGLYDKSQTLRQLSPDDPIFHEARAVVLGAMGKCKEALWVYTFQIRDHEKARAYCYMTNPGGQAEESLSLPTVPPQTRSIPTSSMRTPLMKRMPSSPYWVYISIRHSARTKIGQRLWNSSVDTALIYPKVEV